MGSVGVGGGECAGREGWEKTAHHCKIAKCQPGALLSQVSQFSQTEILHVLLGGQYSGGAGFEQRMW